MKKILRKIVFFESMILRFAESKIDDAYNAFVKWHGYDIRKKENDDHLKFINWEVEDKILILTYEEITQHDCPYIIELEYNLDEINIIDSLD